MTNVMNHIISRNESQYARYDTVSESGLVVFFGQFQSMFVVESDLIYLGQIFIQRKK